MRIIDLRSDTVTQPNEAMRQAMHQAVVGDDSYGEDPTVNQLEEMSAKIFGKEAALFVLSGTMGNLISMLTHCQRGDEIIVGEASHIALLEQRGACSVGGISVRTVPNLYSGELHLDSVRQAINPDDFHFARSKLITIENTWNGNPIAPSYMEAVKELAQENKLKIHLDGARIFNAAIALKIPLLQLVKHADSVQFCLSKGLSAPAGSVICASKSFITDARRVRKLLGGGGRQIGIIAAAGIFALENMIDRLEQDHENAELFVNGLCQFEKIALEPCQIRTNMVFFKVKGFTDSQFVEQLKAKGLYLATFGPFGIRAVTHYGISKTDIIDALYHIKEIVQ